MLLQCLAVTVIRDYSLTSHKSSVVVHRIICTVEKSCILLYLVEIGRMVLESGQ